MVKLEDVKKLRELFYKEYLEENFDDVGVWNEIEEAVVMLDVFRRADIDKDGYRGYLIHPCKWKNGCFLYDNENFKLCEITEAEYNLFEEKFK